MDDLRRTYRAFLEQNHRKAVTTHTPLAHVHFYRGTLTDEPLVQMNRDELIEYGLDPSSQLVQWLFHQLSTYNTDTQRVVALVFDKKTVLSDVLRSESCAVKRQSSPF